MFAFLYLIFRVFKIEHPLVSASRTERNYRKNVMLERLGKVSGWVGTSFALLAFFFAFMKWSPGHGKPFYFGVLAAFLFFLIGQAVRYVRQKLHVNRISSPNVRYWPKADIPSCTAHVRFRG
jgi:hypothetical protein